MRIFIAGATGALGRPLANMLVADGHSVTGLTRSPAKQQLLADLGATPVVADALDRDAVMRVVAEAKPDVVVHALTALPAAGPRRFRDLDATNRLRTEGTANLVAASLASGVRRIVAESIVLVYGHVASGRADESSPPAADAPRALRDGLDAIASLEQQLADLADDVETIALRYGLFYGRGTGSDGMVEALRRRRLPLPPEAGGSVSWIHIGDATSATAAAITASNPGPVYNITDDQPAGIHEFVRELASASGAPAPRTVPRWLAKLAAPYATLATTYRVVADSQRAREELGWSPRFPTIRDGIRAEYGQAVGEDG